MYIKESYTTVDPHVTHLSHIVLTKLSVSSSSRSELSCTRCVLKKMRPPSKKVPSFQQATRASINESRRPRAWAKRRSACRRKCMRSRPMIRYERSQAARSPRSTRPATLRSCSMATGKRRVMRGGDGVPAATVLARLVPATAGDQASPMGR